MASKMKVEDVNLFQTDDEDYGASGFGATRFGRRIKRVLRFVQQGVFGLLYLIAKDQYSSNSVVLSTTIINTLQLLYMSLSERARFPWFWWMTKYMEPVLKVFSLAFVEDLSSTVQIAAFFIFFMLLSFTSAMAVLVQSEFASGGVKNLWALPVLRFFLRLMTTVFYVPVISVLLQSLDCGNPFSDYLGCSSTAHYLFAAVILVLLLWFITFSGLLVLVFGQQDPTTGDAEAGPHKRLEFLNSLIRACLEFAFQALSAQQDELTNPNIPILIVIVNVTGFWLTISYVYFLPYYSEFTNKVMASSYSLFWWSGICLVVAYTVNDTSDFSSILLFFFGGPFFMYSWILAVDLRIDWYIRTQDRPRDSPYNEEVRLRLKYPLLSRPLSNIEGDVLPSETQALLKSERDVALLDYLAAAERFQRDGFFCLHTSLLMERIWQHEVRARKFLKLAEGLPLAFDHLFIVYQKTLQNKERETGARGAISYLAFDHHVKQAKQAMSESVDLIVDFWTTLMDGDYTVKDLHSLSVHIHRTLSRCRLHMRSLLSLNPNSPTALTLYAIYHEYVLNDTSMTRNILGTDDTVSGKALINRILQTQDTKESEFVIAAEGQRFGCIVWASFGLVTQVGRTQNEIQNKPINCLFVSSLQDIITEYLREMVESISTFQPIKLQIFILNKLAICNLVEWTLTPNINDSGSLEFVCRFETVANEDLLLSEELESGYLLINNRGVIVTGCENVWKIVKLSAETVQTSETHISELVPWIHNEMSIRAAEAHKKSTNTVELDGATYLVDVQLYLLESSSDPPRFPAVELHQVKFTQIKSLSGIEKLRRMPSGRPDSFASYFSDIQRSSELFDMEDSDNESGLDTDEDSIDVNEEDLMRHIRKAIEHRINTTSPMVHRFTRQSRWLTLFMIIFACLNAFLFSVHLDEYRDAVSYTETILERNYHITSVATYVQDQIAASQGFLNGAGLQLYTDEQIADVLVSNLIGVNASADSLATDHRLLMSVAQSGGAYQSTNLAFGTNSSLEPAIVLLLSDAPSRKSNLWAAVLELSNHIYAFSQFESPFCGSSCNFTLTNAMQTILPRALEEASELFNEQTLRVNEISQYNLHCLVIFSISTLLMLIQIYFPVLLETIRGRKCTVHAFASIPALLVFEMSEMYASRAVDLVKLTENNGEVEEKEQRQVIRQTQIQPVANLASMGVGNLRKVLQSMGSSLLSIDQVANDSILIRVLTSVSLIAQIGYPAFLMLGLSISFVLFPEEIDLFPVQRTAHMVGLQWMTSSEISFWLKEDSRDGLAATIKSLYDQDSELTYSLNTANSTSDYVSLQDMQSELWSLLFEDTCASRIADDLPCNTTTEIYQQLANLTNGTYVTDFGLSNGLHFMHENFLEYTRKMIDLEAKLENRSASLAEIEDILAQKAIMARPSTLFTSLLSLQKLSSTLAYEYVVSIADAIQSHRVASLMVACIFLLLSHFGVCRTVNAVDSDTQKNLILLMMVPEKVFKQRPQILDLLQVEQMEYS